MTIGKTVSKEKKLKKWLLIIVVFVALQVFFTVTDGTFLEIKLNNIGNFAVTLTSNLSIFEWITIYEHPYYKLVTVIFILHIAYLAIKDLVSIKRQGRDVS